MITRPNPTFVINQRIKELNKYKRRLKTRWHKYSKMEKDLQESAPRYSNIYDYSSDYGHETIETLSVYGNQINGAISKIMKIDDERRYLQSIIRSAKDKKYKIDSFGRYH